MEAIVLAGGLGTRLASRLNGIPKPMAPVAGRPFLEILLSRLAEAGCGRVILSVGHLSSVIQDYFGSEFRGMPLAYAVETSPLGTGGAIRIALEAAQETNVLVLNGDTFVSLDYEEMLEFHEGSGAQVTMAVSPQTDVARYGEVVLAPDAVMTADRVAGFREKGRSGPGWINAGVYVLGKDFPWPAGVGEKFSFETDVLMAETDRLRIAAFPAGGGFIDIGVPEDLDRAQTELASR